MIRLMVWSPNDGDYKKETENKTGGQKSACSLAREAMLPRPKKLSLQSSILIPRWAGAEYVGDRTRRQVTRSHIPDADGWVTPDLPFELFNEARTHLLGLGRAVEVLEPETLRKCLIDFSEQTIDFYENKKGQDDWIGIFC
ncbi:WYL domain-containing protein [Candidatus Villigracilis saccharophilus]|uniref:WYL domain-containing protein n=1 Tax=Candidatus Villigracilis saccharophilus TaxID=3140684 RepID=UPI0031F16494